VHYFGGAPPKHKHFKVLIFCYYVAMKTILVTGASDGIGRSIAIKLANEGHNLILCGRDEQKLQTVAKECDTQPKILAFDINDTANRKGAVATISELDVLINNAGIWHKVGELETLDDELIVDVINTNLTSQILLTKSLLPLLKDKEGSAIINIISKSGITAQEGQSVYSASKWGMRGFTDVLRNDTKDNAVRVGAIYQSGTNTKLFEKASDDFPVETFTEPDDLADVIVFMLNRPKKLWINEIRIEK
jgi:NADP-dependent 3-hydroxy acid dehydrogenase YdfG